MLRRLADVAAAHLARTPEWEMKCALGLHLWLDTEHATLLRGRIAELRQPPLHLDQAPDAQLEAVMEETLRAQDTAELLGAVYAVLRPEILAGCPPAARRDEPALRSCHGANPPHDRARAGGGRRLGRRSAASMDTKWSGDPAAWAFGEHVRSYLAAAGGLLGTTEPAPAMSLPRPRWDGSEYEIDPRPQRDDRFADPFNATARIDEIYADDAAPPRERSLALACKRLREMDVPEWMGPILFAARTAPWERRRDLARQVWDETRHAMMAETVVEAVGVPFHAYPIDMAASASLNTEFTPLEAHLVLWHIEQGLMRSSTGKRFEWDVARLDDDPMIANLQELRLGRRGTARRSAGAASRSRSAAGLARRSRPPSKSGGRTRSPATPRRRRADRGGRSSSRVPVCPARTSAVRRNRRTRQHLHIRSRSD